MKSIPRLGRKTTFAAIFSFVTGAFFSPTLATVTVYPTPAGIPASTAFSVKADAQTIFVNHMIKALPISNNQAPKADFASFAFTDSAQITIKYDSSFSSVTIRPLSLGIAPQISDSTVKFTLKKPGYLSVEFNGKTKAPLLLFADAPDTNIPSPTDTNVYFFAGGTVYDSSIFLYMNNNKTIYLAGGAILRGYVDVYSSNNVTVRGHGIIADTLNEIPFVTADCRNLSIDGPIVICEHDTSDALQINHCSDSKISHVKVLNTNNSGVNLSNDTKTVLQSSFLCSVDNTISLKGNPWFADNGSDSVYNDTVRKCIVWNSGTGSSLEVGRATLPIVIQDCLFDSIDIIHSEPVVSGTSDPYFTSAVFGIHNGGGPEAGTNPIRRIRYQNIRVEDCREPFLVDFSMPTITWVNQPCPPANRVISDIYFQNIAVASTSSPSQMIGRDASHKVQNITFDNFRINNVPVASKSALNLDTNTFVSNVVFLNTAVRNPLSSVALRASRPGVRLTLNKSITSGRKSGTAVFDQSGKLITNSSKAAGLYIEVPNSNK